MIRGSSAAGKISKMCGWIRTSEELPPDGARFVTCDESGWGDGEYLNGRWFKLDEFHTEMPRPPAAWFIPEPPEWLLVPQLKVVK